MKYGDKYVVQKGSAAMPCTCPQFTPLLVEKSGIKADVTFGTTASKKELKKEYRQEIQSGF